MKTHLLLLFWLAFAWQATAQGVRPIIGSYNVPPAGSKIYINPVIPNDLDPGLAGEDREYNFAYTVSRPLDSLYWLTPDSVQSKHFPEATIVTNYYGLYRRLYENMQSNLPYIPSNYYGETVLRSDTGGLTILGNLNKDTYNILGNGDTVFFLEQKAPFHPSRLTLPFGFKYGDEIPETETMQEFYGARLRNGKLDTFKVVRRTRTKMVADGQGRISTPNAYYDNTLRVRTEIHEVDSLYLNNGFFIERYKLNELNPTQFSWYVPQKNWEVFTMIYNGDDVIYANYLVDDTNPNINFAQLSSTVPENIGVIKIPVRISQPQAKPVTVVVKTNISNSTAIPMQDFVPIENMVLTFEPGETLKMVELAILEDSLIEEDKSFIVQIERPSDNGVIGTVNNHYIKVIDNDRPYLHFSVTDTTILEDVNVAYIPLRISKPITEDSVTIRIQTIARDARSDVDYGSFDYIHTIRPNTAVTPIPVRIINDNFNEENETFVIKISAVSPNSRIGFSDTIAIHIQDDEFKPNVRFLYGDTLVREATNEPGNMLSIPVRLGYRSSEPITVTYKFIDGTAVQADNASFVQGGDYFANSNSLTFKPGETIKHIQLLVNNDLLVENTEYFDIQLLEVSEWGQMGYTDTIIRVMIEDNDPFVSTDKLLDKENIKLYPNPTTGAVNMILNNSIEIKNIMITDILGKSYIVDYQRNGDKITWDMNAFGFSNGIYQIKIITDQSVLTQKVIFNK